MADWLWATMFVFGLGLAIGLAIGAGLGYFLLHRHDRRRERQQEEKLAHERREQEEERTRERQEQQRKLEDSFDLLARRALDRNAEQQRERLDSTLRPMHETLQETRKQLKEIENKRHEHYGGLEGRLLMAVESQRELRKETQILSDALAKPDMRGHWGEVKLERVLECAGMRQYCRDFDKQVQIKGGGRPDVVVQMPGDRNLVIDAKLSLVAYQNALREQDPSLKQKHLETHADQMRQKVLELEKKKYWAQIENTLNFVVMFVPADHLLDAALEQRPLLMEEAFKKKILLATPSSLMGILQAVEHCWQQQKLAENTKEIRDLGDNLIGYANNFLKHMKTFHDSLNKCVDACEAATGSWRHRIHPTLKKFHELGVSSRVSEPPAKLETRVEKKFPDLPTRDDAA